MFPEIGLATADLAVYKSVSADPVSTGSAFSYQVTIVNDGPDDAAGVVMTDTLPPGVTAGMVTSSQGTCAPPTGTVTCTLGAISAFDAATVDIAVTAPATTGLITNSASATTTDTDPDLSNNTATVETTVVDPGADLAIGMYAEPDPAATNAPLTYTLQVSNLGPDDATGVSVTDTLPGGVTFDDASLGCAHASGTVTCVVGSVARHDTVNLEITVITPSLPGMLTNTASVDGNEPDPDTNNNTVTVETQLRTPADLGVAVADSPDPIVTGETLTYTTTVTNSGPGSAPAVAMSQVLHPRTTFVSATPTTGSCSEESGTVTCGVGTLANGASVTITITATKTDPGVISSVATVSGDVGDTDPENDSDTEYTNNPTALDLAQALAQQTGFVTGATFDAVPPTGTPNDAQTRSLGGFPTDGSTYTILTSGDATLAETPNTSPSTGADVGGPNVRGNTDYDVTVLKVDLDVPAGPNCLSIDFRFLSDEFPEYVQTAYNDAFIAELDISDWTTSGSTITAPHNFAFDEAHNEISINAAGAASMSEGEAAGTTYDGATPLLSASTPITSGAHSLYLSIFDQGDHIYDSAIFLDRLRLGTAAGETCQQGATVLTASKTADSGSTPAGGQNGYTITITNPGAQPATLTTISDMLPAGFSYVPGSTTGATTNDPTIAGQVLTWSGTFPVPASGTQSLHFLVTVSSTTGTYFNTAGAGGPGVSVTPTGPTAPIVVTPGPPPP
ncbi:MAG TPA: choice-of-anchor L domain-containing protein, partial [Desertimonas sp.]|nr:choice-of-anchor L domain-containing protein [Desertimonas sp.]